MLRAPGTRRATGAARAAGRDLSHPAVRRPDPGADRNSDRGLGRRPRTRRSPLRQAGQHDDELFEGKPGGYAMSGDGYDVQGEVRDALNTAVEGYGKRVLNDPRILSNLVTDLLPDLPRERSLLVTGAEAGIADELAQHVERQRMDADTAVALVARSLAESRALAPAASMWVATEYAKALGYQVRSQLPPSVAEPADTPPWPQHDETQTANQATPPLFPPAGQMPPTFPPPGQLAPTFPPPGQMPPTFPPAPPGPWPAAPTRPRKSRL